MTEGHRGRGARRGAALILRAAPVRWGRCARRGGLDRNIGDGAADHTPHLRAGRAHHGRGPGFTGGDGHRRGGGGAVIRVVGPIATGLRRNGAGVSENGCGTMSLPVCARGAHETGRGAFRTRAVRPERAGRNGALRSGSVACRADEEVMP